MRFSNETLLTVSMCLFLAFAVAELTGAVISESLALLGDSISMCVDVFTYFFNVYVEWYKHRYAHSLAEHSFMTRLVTDIFVPLLSLLSLILVAVYISYDAIVLLLHPPSHNTVNIEYLYSYALANLLVDAVCNFLYWMRSEDVFIENNEVPKLSLDTSLSPDVEIEFGRLDDDLLDSVDSRSATGYGLMQGNSKDSNDYNAFCFGGFRQFLCCSLTDKNQDSIAAEPKTNLNMLSAYMHVLGDSFRTVSTFIAAFISTITGIDGDICDAWAALIAAITIVVLCVPVMKKIRNMVIELWQENISEKYGGNARSYSSLSRSSLSDEDISNECEIKSASESHSQQPLENKAGEGTI